MNVDFEYIQCNSLLNNSFLVSLAAFKAVDSVCLITPTLCPFKTKRLT